MSDSGSSSTQRERRKRRLRAIDGQLVIEPDLPPGALCGGYQAAYLRAVPAEELERVSRDPALSASASQSVFAELERRRNSSQADPK
jgi:hypothetical protein